MIFMMLPDFLSDISVKIAAVPPHIEGATAHGVLWQAAPRSFLIDAPDVARYLVEEGSCITIDPSPQADETDMRRFFRMTPLVALLFQRGILAFHAAAVAGPAGAILIAGDSGAGKSTLLAALLKRGWLFLADDLAAVNLDQNGLPMVYPHFPEVMLWTDTMEKLEFENVGKGRQRLPMKEQFIATPQPLRAICRLSVHKDEIEISSIEGVKLFNTLTTLSYNSRIADALLDRTAFMRTAAAIARTVPLHSLRRPRGRWCVDELADLLEKEFR
jgi:hypothetical protein